VVFVLLCIGGDTAMAADVWIKSFPGLAGGTAPNGYRYDPNLFGQDIEVGFNYDSVGLTTGLQISINGGPYTSAFSCTDGGGFDDSSCLVTLPYSCGKVTFRVRRQHVSPNGTDDSNPVEIFVFNNADCVPQCDSCQLASDGGGPGKPINVTTGKLWYQNHDIQLSGPQGLRFSRWYDNHSSYSRDLGYGWRHNYNAYLDLSTGGRIIFIDEEGRKVYFNGLGAGGSAHDEITGADLALDSPATTYTLTLWKNAKMRFDLGGNLTAVIDRIGNTQTIGRDAGNANRITSITDTLSRSIAFGYDSQNRITSITSNPSGVSLSYTYDVPCGTGNLCSATMPDGETWTYEYTDADPHNLTRVIDPLGNAEEINTYYGAGADADKVMQQSTPPLLSVPQSVLNFSYSTGSTTVTDGLSRTTTYNFDPKTLLLSSISGPGCGCGGGEAQSFDYDNLMRKRSSTDGAGATHAITWAYGRDVRSAPHDDGFQELIHSYPSATSRTEPLSSGVNRTTSWTYYPISDPRQDLIQTETVPSADTSGQNRVTPFTYATNGLLTSEVVQGRVASVVTTYTTSYTYDPNGKGRLQTIDGPRTDVTDLTTLTYFPDSDSDLARRGQLQTSTDAVGNVTSYAASSAPFNTYDRFGNPKSTIDPNLVVREMTYDGQGRLLTSTIKGVAGDTADLVTTNTYRDDGLLGSVTYPLANGVGYIYDTSDRLTDTVRTGADGKQYERLHVTYDAMSQKRKEEAQSCDTPASTCASWTTQRRQEFDYDSYGRLWQVIQPDGFIRYLRYDSAGNLQDIQDERHSAPNILYGYDYANRLTSITEKQTLAPGSDLLTQYSYDVQNNLSSVTDARANPTTYIYDDFDRLRQVVAPASGTTTRTHDPVGNVLTETDSAATPVTVTRTYDAINRLKTETYPDASLNAIYTYDEAAVAFGKGRLTHRTDPSGTTKFSFERRGLPVLEERTVGAAVYTTTFQYDGNGNRRLMGYPAGAIYLYGFDFADRPASIQQSGGSTLASGALYKPFGPIATWTYGNNRTETRGYDLRYQLTSQIVNGSVVDRTYGHDGVGNLNSLTDNLAAGNNRTFGYDDLNRLVTANAPSLWGSGAFTYDGIGNRLTKTIGANTTTYGYNSGGVFLQSATGAEPGTYTYSPNPSLGQITGDGVHVYGYDQRHRLSSIDAKTFKHSADGFRTRSTSGSTTTEYFFAPEGSLIARLTGTVWVEYLWLGDLPIAQIPGGGLATIGNFLREQRTGNDVQLTWTGGASSNIHVLRGTIGSWFTSQDLTPSGLSGTSYTDSGAATSPTNYRYKVMQAAPGLVQYLHANPVGLPNRITDASGASVWQAEEFPFGDLYTQSGSSNTSLRFPGQYDESGGIYQNQWRFYFPALGRYSQPDPLIIEPSTVSGIASVYLYVSGRPTRLIDPFGLFEMDDSCNPCQKRNSAGPSGPHSPANSPSHSQYAYIYLQVKAACQTVVPSITNVSLRRCLEKQCKDGSVECRNNCPATKLGGTVDVAMAFFFRQKGAPICVNNWRALRYHDPGRVAVHEWAHGCHWFHGQPGGVPGRSGNFEDEDGPPPPP